MPYQDPADFRLLPELVRLAPPEAEAFVAFDKAVAPMGSSRPNPGSSARSPAR